MLMLMLFVVVVTILASVIGHADGRVARIIMRIRKGQRRQGPKRHLKLQFEPATVDGLFEIPAMPELGLLRFKGLQVGGLFVLVLLLQLCEALGVLVDEIVQFVVHALGGLEESSFLALAEHFDLGFVQLVHGPVVVVFLRELCFLLLGVLARLLLGEEGFGAGATG